MNFNLARSIINSIEGCLYALDRQFQIIHSNDGWKQVHGEHGWLTFDTPPQEGFRLLNYVPDHTRRRRLEQVFQEVLVTGQCQELQSATEGGRHWVMTASPLHHEGQIVGLIYLVTTNSRMAWTRSQLFHTQRLNTLGAVVGGVAHDFNNLILAMRGNVALVTMNQQLPTEARARLQQADEAAARATDLSRQLQSLSRPSRGELLEMDFNELVEAAIDLSKKVFRGRIKVQLRPAANPLPVRINGVCATQALINVCLNAWEAMPKGGTLTITNSMIELTAAQRQKSTTPACGHFMRCTLTDTGCGIPATILPRLFHPFVTTKPEGQGAGLGLVFVREVFQQAGGFIEVESAVDRGTTFHLHLPLVIGSLARKDI